VRLSKSGVTWRFTLRLGAALAGVAVAVTACGSPASVRPASLARRETSPAPARRPTASPSPSASPTASAAQAARGLCTSAQDPRLAARLSAGIRAALAARVSVVSLAVDDPARGLTCQFHPWWRDDSASVAKVMILAALLHQLTAEGRWLSPEQDALARQMITESSDTAASTLWADEGPDAVQDFLNLAGMRTTTPGPGIYWGLTQVDAHDEMLLLRLLVTRNAVLDHTEQDYILRLMAEVTPSQRWGVPAGRPAGVTVHVKNGWLPDPTLWVINSLGDFTSSHGDVSIAILTHENPDMAYGIDTIQAAAGTINHDLGRP